MINEIEEILRLNYINKIPDNVLNYLLKVNFNIKIYDNFIGRNFNFRKSEWTNISKYKNKKEINNILKIPHHIKTIKKNRNFK